MEGEERGGFGEIGLGWETIGVGNGEGGGGAGSFGPCWIVVQPFASVVLIRCGRAGWRRRWDVCGIAEGRR